MIQVKILFVIFLATELRFCAGFFGKTNLFNTHEEPGYDLLDEFKISKDNQNVKEKWIKQKLDHFDSNNKQEWNMRYLENSQHYKHGGPIFIYVGGEWSISPKRLTMGHMFDIAKELNGIMFYTEHRFYGKSRPTKDTSNDNLRYLSVQQGLADLENFIRHIKSSNNFMNNAGVVLVGASYSATVATWARLKFPDLVNGVWSSSGPLYAKLDFSEYNEVSSESIRVIGGEKCQKRIANAFSQLEKYFAFSEPKVLYKIQQNFNLCEPVKLCRDTPHFFYELSDTFSGLVQLHKYDDIQNACNFITQNKFSDDVEAIGAWIQSDKQVPCIDMNYDNFLRKYNNTAWDSEASEQMRQWIYQTCDSFGWFQSGNSLKHIFGSKHPQIGYFVKICRDLYGDRFNEHSISQSVYSTNIEFGGYEPPVTNVYSTHGYLDPWKRMGAQKDLHQNSPTVVLKGYSHCADLNSISQLDSQEMKESKIRIRNLIKGWLNI